VYSNITDISKSHAYTTT